MPEIIGLDRRSQFGIETTPGVAVPITKYFSTLGLKIDPDEPTGVVEPMGSKYAVGSYLMHSASKGSWNGMPSYAELAYPISSAFGAPVITTPTAGVLSRQMVWVDGNGILNAPVTLTIERGDAVDADRTPGITTDSVGLTFSRTAAVAVKSAVLGGQMTLGVTQTPLAGVGVSAVQTLTITGTPSGGTFTLTVLGATTAPIAYNATAAAVQAAILAALATAFPWLGGSTVTVTGTALPAGTLVITFGGDLTNTPVPLSTGTGTFTGGTTPAVVIANTTTGVAITAENKPIVLTPKATDFYVDSSFGNLGLTPFVRTFTADWDVTGKYVEGFPLMSSNLGYATMVEKKSSATIKFRLATDAAGRAQLAALRANTRQFVRMQNTGPVLEGSINFMARFEFAIDITNAGSEGDQGGIYTREFTGHIVHDGGWGKALQFTTISRLQGL